MFAVVRLSTIVFLNTRLRIRNSLRFVVKEPTILISVSITYQYSHKEVSSLYAPLQISPTPQATTPMQRPAILVDDLSYTSHGRACCFAGPLLFLRRSVVLAFPENPVLKKCLVCSETSLQHAAVREKQLSKTRLIPPRASAQEKTPKDQSDPLLPAPRDFR